MNSFNIILIRHAESKFNAGTCKSPEELTNCRITENGKTQSQNLNLNFEILVLSPLKRALETYLNSNIKTKEVVISPIFREYKDGNPCNILELEDNKVESIEEVKNRVREAHLLFDNLSKSYKNIGVISHGLFIYHYIESLGFNPFILDNCKYIQLIKTDTDYRFNVYN